MNTNKTNTHPRHSKSSSLTPVPNFLPPYTKVGSFPHKVLYQHVIYCKPIYFCNLIWDYIRECLCKNLEVDGTFQILFSKYFYLFHITNESFLNAKCWFFNNCKNSREIKYTQDRTYHWKNISSKPLVS